MALNEDSLCPNVLPLESHDFIRTNTSKDSQGEVRYQLGILLQG